MYESILVFLMNFVTGNNDQPLNKMSHLSIEHSYGSLMHACYSFKEFKRNTKIDCKTKKKNNRNTIQYIGNRNMKQK